MALEFLISPSDKEQVGALELATLASVYSEHFLLSGAVEVSLIDLGGIRELNHEYRSLDEPTDVLSFPTFFSVEEIRSLPEGEQPLLGSIIICPEKASAYGETLPQLVHHGLLHLLGFDHEQDMEEWSIMEQAVLATLAARHLSIPPVPHDPF